MELLISIFVLSTFWIIISKLTRHERIFSSEWRNNISIRPVIFRRVTIHKVLGEKRKAQGGSGRA